MGQFFDALTGDNIQLAEQIAKIRIEAAMAAANKDSESGNFEMSSAIGVMQEKAAELIIAKPSIIGTLKHLIAEALPQGPHDISHWAEQYRSQITALSDYMTSEARTIKPRERLARAATGY